MLSDTRFPEPIQIVVYNERLKKIEFDLTEFSKIAKINGIKDLPIAVISIVGDSRKGKSFLLNYFLRYLQRYDQKDWIGDPNEPLKGFAWKRGVENVTHGIFVWSKPLVITKGDGTQIAVLLMDTQGLFDDQTEDEASMDIFAISSLLSSIQIYNKSNNIQSNHITQLSKLINHFKAKQNNLVEFNDVTALEKPEKLWFLIRDCAFQDEYSFDVNGGRQFLQFKKSSQSNTFKETWDIVDGCYSQIDCFLMPHPGLGATTSPDFKGETCNLDSDFVDSLRKLVSDLLSPENIKTKTKKDGPMKVSEFVEFVGKFGMNLVGNGSIYGDEAQSAFDNISRALEVKENASLIFFTNMAEIYSQNNTVKQLKLRVEAARLKAVSFYTRNTYSIDSEIRLQNLQDLEASLKVTTLLFENNAELISGQNELPPQPLNSSTAQSSAVQRFSIKTLILRFANIFTPAFLFRLIRARFTRNRR